MANNKLKDPTQVGTSGLSGINTKEGAKRYLESLGFTDSMQEYKIEKATRPFEAPVQEVGRVGLNDSRFDRKITSLTQLEDLEDTRSDTQPWYSKIGAGVGKGAVLAGTTFLDGIAGTIIGAINGLDNIGSDNNLNAWQEFWSGFWDNPFSQAMQQVNEWSEQALPNYLSKEERDNILNGEGYKNMFTANWWGNSFIKNLGFSVGAFYSGNVISGVLKNATPLVKTVVGSTISAINEGKVEALNNANDWYKNELNKLDEAYRRELEMLEQNYGNSDMYTSLVQNATNTYNEAITQLNSDKAKVGNVDLALNIPILTASNWFMWGKLYSGGAKTAINTTSIAKRNGKYVTNAAYKAVTGPISEGTEEMAQKVAATIPQIKYSSDIENFYTMRFSPNESRETIDWLQSTMQGISDVVGDKNSWEEFAIGVMTGVLGMPSFRSVKSDAGKIQSPVILEGGLWESIDDYKRENSIVKELNSRISDPKFSEYYQGLVRHNKYQSDMNNAALNGDMFQYKNAEDSQLISDIILFDKAGRLQDIEQMINQAFNTSDENIQNIINVTTDDKGNGPFSVDGNAKPTNYIIESITEQKNNILSAINDYRESKDSINGILAKVDKQLSDPELEELIWLKSKSNAWKKRFNDLSEEVKMKFRSVSDGYKIHHPERSDVIDSMSQLLSLSNDALVVALSNDKNSDNIKVTTKLVSDLSNNLNLDWRDLGQDIKDLTLLAKNKNRADEKLTEYILNPNRLTEDTNKAKIESDKANAEKDRDVAINKLNNVTNFSDIDQLLNSGEVVKADINKATSYITKDYEKANLFKNKALEYINNNFDDKYKNIAIGALNERYSNSTNYSDLANPKLVTDFGFNYTVLDTRVQEDIKFRFDTMLSAIADKLIEGEKIKELPPVENSPKVGNPVGRDDIPQTPGSSDNIDTNKIKKSIDEANLNEEQKSVLKEAIDNISNNLDLYKKNRNPNTIRHIRTLANTLRENYTNDIINNYLNKVENIIKSDTYIAGESNEVLNDNSNSGNSESYPETAVSNVMKAAIPQFDLTAKKDGLLVEFSNPNYAYVYGKLKEVDSDGKSAFDYVNEGNVKVGDKLDVTYEAENENHPEIFWLYHNGHLVNALHAKSSIDGAEAIKTKAREGKNPTVTVTKIMDGKFEYTRETNRPVKDIMGINTVNLGIMKNGVMVSNTNEVIDAPFDSNHTDGKVYLLLPNSRGTLSPKQLQIVHFNNIEFNSYDSPIGKEVTSIIDSLTNLMNVDAGKLELKLDDIFIDMVETFYIPDSFHIDTFTRMSGESFLRIGYNDRNGNRKNTNILLKSEASKPILSLFGDSKGIEAKTVNKEDVRNQILNTLQDANLAFNINAKKLVGKDSSSYVNKLIESDVLRTYLTSNRMRGTWFLLNEKPDTVHIDTFTAYKAERDSRNKVRVPNIYGKEYTVEGDVIYTQDGKVADVDNELERKIKDLAHIISTYGDSRYGINQHNGWVLIEDANGKRGVNRNTTSLDDMYLSDEQIKTLEAKLANRKPQADKARIAINNFIESQKNVRRTEEGSPKTDTGYYEILEEDGQYHQYERVHSVIGSNYNGPSANNAATTFGSMVDELVRQFFIDSSKMKKPDNMSDEAYNNLKHALRKFKATADSNGISIITDRLVVYKKYPNGKRIAGELDMLSYNSFTGNISIVDTKTSKYSTTSSDFRVASKYQTRSTEEQYTLQLSAYSKLFEDSFDFPISKLTIMPFKIVYNDGNLTRLNSETQVSLNKRDDVFAGNVPIKTFKGQYVTTGTGKIEYHTAEMREILNLGGYKYYLATVGDVYKLIIPNGRSMILPNDKINSSMSDDIIKLNLMEILSDENIQNMISKTLAEDKYLNESPYGTTILIDDKYEEIKNKGIAAADKLNSLKVSGKSKRDAYEESVQKRSEDKKSKPQETLTFGNEVTARKKWSELSENEKSIIMSSFGGADESEIQKYWDSVDYIQREKMISCP